MNSLLSYLFSKTYILLDCDKCYGKKEIQVKEDENAATNIPLSHSLVREGLW